MKRFLFCILLLTSLIACSRASSFNPYQCNNNLGVCVDIKVDELVKVGEPVAVTVKVDSKKDITDLWVSLAAPGNVYFEDPDLKTWKKNEMGLKIKVKANKPYTSKHKVRLPLEDGYYSLVVGVGTQDYGQIASNSVEIVIINGEGKFYYSGTKIPGSEGTTLIPAYTVTPGPSPTPYPTPTVWGGATSYP